MDVESQVRPVIAALCRKYSRPGAPPELKFGDQSPSEASVIGAKHELVLLSATFRVSSSAVYPALSKHLTDLEHCNIRFIDRSEFVKMLIDGLPSLIRNIYKERFGSIYNKELKDIVDPCKMLERDLRSS